jgi:3',5'-cyclic AMP phosphodiesterase CpdA
MKIIHFSDPHAGGPAEDWLAYVDKRWVGVFNFSYRRKYQHDQSYLKKAVDYIIEQKPDLAVLTGDITSTGQQGEFKQQLDILDPLVRNTQIQLMYIPGNHDYYVYNKKCVDAMKYAVRVLNRANFSFDELPVKISLGDCDFILVNESCPTNLLSSCGYLSRESSDFIVKACAEKQEKPLVLIGHYPIIEDHPILRVRHKLWGEKETLELLKSGKIDLSLCGHVHRPYAKTDERGRGEICAGSITRNGCVTLINYDKTKDVFSREVVHL